MNRTNLYLYNDTSDGFCYKAGCPADIVGSDPDEWRDVTGDKIHTLRAVLEGEWIGANPLPRDLSLRGSEHGEQTALFCWSAAVANTIDERAGLMFAIPNGGKRDAKTAAMLKAEGVRKGVPDVFLPVPVLRSNVRINFCATDLYHTDLKNDMLCGLFIEMKRTEKGRASDAQNDRITRLRADGYGAVIVKGWAAAAAVVMAYLGIEQ